MADGLRLRDADRLRFEQVYAELLWRQAAADPKWFMRECVWIPSQRDPRGKEPFDLFDYQEDDLDAFRSEKYAIVLKCRQIGLSTLVGAYALWLAITQPGTVILWISNNQGNANKAIAMLEVMWANLPQWVRDRAPDLTSDAAGTKEWTFADGMKSRIRAYAGTKTAGASETASLVVLDEFALVEDQDNLFRTTDPTTDAGGRLLVISTARGSHNRFAQMFRRGQRGESRFRAIFHPWMVSRFVNPLASRYGHCADCGASAKGCTSCVDRTERDAKAAEFPDQPWLLDAEYPETAEDAFRESGNPRFGNLPPLEECDTGWVRGDMTWGTDGEPHFAEDPDGPLRIRRDVAAAGPDRWRPYVLHVDPSQGIGGDFTAAHVMTWDDDQMPTIAAWWHANDVEPVEAARRMDRLGRWFTGRGGAALLSVESTGGWGDSMLNELHLHLGYTRLYSHRPTGHRKRTTANKLGFPMHQHRRPLVIDRLAQWVGDGAELLGGLYPELRYELGTFVRTENGRYQADLGCHDDLVMSAAAGLWLLVEETTATEPPKGDGPAPVATGSVSLDGLKRRIEGAQRADAARRAEADRKLARTLRSRRRRATARRR